MGSCCQKSSEKRLTELTKSLSDPVRLKQERPWLFWFRRCVLAPVIVYRYCISPLLGQNCRFEPTCSQYAEQAIMEFGILKGLWLSIRRVIKCHPWHKGGYDPLPNKDTK